MCIYVFSMVSLDHILILNLIINLFIHSLSSMILATPFYTESVFACMRIKIKHSNVWSVNLQRSGLKGFTTYAKKSLHWNRRIRNHKIITDCDYANNILYLIAIAIVCDFDTKITYLLHYPTRDLQSRLGLLKQRVTVFIIT